MIHLKIKKKYGITKDLIRQIKEWGIQEVNFIETVNELTMPKIVKTELKTMGLLYGIK